MVVCKYQKYRPREPFVNHDKGYDRVMVSCALTQELCPCQVECENTEQFVLGAEQVRYCKNYCSLV